MHTELSVQKLIIKSFKGIHERTVEFKGKVTNITADNGYGKSSIADAWSWLLFGKNSNDEAKFDIKPLDDDNVLIPKTEVDVTGHVRKNDRPIILRRVYREVWKTTRGSTQAEFSGNTTLYFIDGAPHSEAEYKAEISKLIDESIFKLITNAIYFNTMPWQKRREVLMQMAGEVSNLDIARGNAEFKPLIEILTNKTLSKYKQEVQAKKKDIKDALDPIPHRITEVQQGKPQPEDYEVIQVQIDSRNEDLAGIDAEMENLNQALTNETELIRKYNTQLRAWKVDQDAVADKIRQVQKDKKADAGKGLRDKKAELQTAERNFSQCETSIEINEKKKKGFEELMIAGRQAWKDINAEIPPVMGPDETACPSCKQELPYDKIETKRGDMEKNFNEDKTRRLAANIEKGRGLKKELTEVEELLTTRYQEHKILEDSISELKTSIEKETGTEQEAPADVELLIKSDSEYISIGKKIAEMEANPPKEKEDDGTIETRKQRKKALNGELDDLKKRLNTKDQIEKADNRIVQLTAEEKSLSQQFASLQGQEALIEQFTKARIEEMTTRVNDKFKLVRFKMFNYLQNGGVEETCEVTVDGVPYSSLNTAKRVNAGVDVINALCEHYGVRAPIFLDNRESVTKLIPTESQIVNLIAMKGVKELRIEHVEEPETA